jgi:2'-5' RNA ligase
MSSNLVIAAIPDEDDRVWRISSEKIPHMTILFLGDSNKVANLEQIMQFVQHAAETSLKRFDLPVDRRGELGEDKADVLFFKQGYGDREIRDFRSTLLQDQNIKTAYDSSPQFEGGWKPHLTLGYPETPAKSIPEDHPKIYDVRFNKIAVWTGDFQGPDFLLKDYWDEMANLDIPMDVAMSSLAHYGKKGMKWGVRKEDRPSETKREGAQRFLDPQGHELTTDVAKTIIGSLVPIVAPLTWPSQVRLMRGGVRGTKAKLLDRQEKKFAKNAMSPKNFAAIHNGSLDKINRDIDGHNKKYPDLSEPATKKAYDNAVLKSMQDGYRESANSLVNKTNTMHLDVEFKNDGMDFLIHAKQGPGKPQAQRVQHADDIENDEITVEITGKIKRDATGHIVGFEFDDFKNDSLAQTMELGAEFLSHYGIKGMHWGVRRQSAVTTQSHIDSGILRRQTRIQTKGGESHPAANDAVKAAVNKQKLKKSGVAALSNAELRELQTRIQLEMQVKQLMTSKGQKLVTRQLEEEGKQQLSRGVRKAALSSPSVAKTVRKGARKTAATVATTAVLL